VCRSDQSLVRWLSSARRAGIRERTDQLPPCAMCRVVLATSAGLISGGGPCRRMIYVQISGDPLPPRRRPTPGCCSARAATSGELTDGVGPALDRLKGIHQSGAFRRMIPATPRCGTIGRRYLVGAVRSEQSFALAADCLASEAESFQRAARQSTKTISVWSKARSRSRGDLIDLQIITCSKQSARKFPRLSSSITVFRPTTRVSSSIPSHRRVGLHPLAVSHCTEAPAHAGRRLSQEWVAGGGRTV
jgi:hypothetical protein